MGVNADMNIFVTGASGFVGNHLVPLLKARGMVVTAPVGSQTSQQRPDLFSIGARELSDTDCVIHLAARAHVLRETEDDPLTVFRRVNREGTLSLARAAATAGVRRFIFMSSIGVLGNQTRLGRPFSAESRPAPHNAYAIAKHEAELGLRQIAEQSGLEVVILRPPLVYGPNAKGNFAAMLRWLERGIPLPLGAVNNRRSLVGIDNLADLIIRCIDHPAAANQTFLVSDGEDLSTAELLRRTARALHRPARLIPVPESLLSLSARLVGREDVAARLLASLEVDIQKTRRLLQWAPPVNVDDGLRRAVSTQR